MLACWGVLIYASADFPAWGDPHSPASEYLSPYYLEKGVEDTAVPNIVTAVLADYRGFDTLFETTVVLAAGLACFLLLRVYESTRPRERLYRHSASDLIIRIQDSDMEVPESDVIQRVDRFWTPRDMIVRTVCRLLIPFIQIYALYVVGHGHHSPGGGFQGGVVLGAAFILLAISYDLRTCQKRVTEKFIGILSPVGVLIYAGTGVLCMVLGANFLDYSSLARVLYTDPVMARSHGILLVEIGVAVTVMATMVLIYTNLSSAGRHRQGL
ncbi:MAG: Na(+)/H(+) antiporter subunit B [Desulfatibacillaceae bacterium]